MGPRRRSVVWAESARQQLGEALAYVAQDSPGGALRLLHKILDTGASLAVLSERGPVVSESAAALIREILVDPFRLFYQVRESEVIVIAVLHQRQDFS